jgi:hypothetical protein
MTRCYPSATPAYSLALRVVVTVLAHKFDTGLNRGTQMIPVEESIGEWCYG